MRQISWRSCSRTNMAAALSAPGTLLACPHAANRGGRASTSGRHLPTVVVFEPTRVVRVLAVQQDAAATHQGGLGLAGSEDEAPLTPRRVMNRRIKSCVSLSQLSSLVVDDVGSFDQANTACALNRLAKMYAARYTSLSQTNLLSGDEQQQARQELRPALEALTKRLTQIIYSCSAWDITVSLWSFAQLGWHDEATLQSLCDAALQLTPTFKPVDCAQTVTAFTQIGYVHPELLRHIVTSMLDTLDDFRPAEVAQVLWGMARLGVHPGGTFLAEVVDAVQWRLQHYATQELLMCMWALVRLGYRPGPRFLLDVERVLLQRLPLLAPVDVAMATWALARLRYKAVRLLDELPAAVVPELRLYGNRELCGLLSGYATAKHYHRTLLEEVAGTVVHRLPTLTHQEVCVVLWAYGLFRHRPSQPDFGRRVAAELHGRLGSMTPQGLAMVAKGLAQLQWRSGPLMAQLVAAAEQKLTGFKPLELSQLLWGLSSLQCRELSIYYAAVRRCIAVLQDPQHPHYKTMRHHRVLNSVIASCQHAGYVPWALVDFAESKGIRVKQPGNLSSRDEEDEGVLGPTFPPSSAPSSPDGSSSSNGVPHSGASSSSYVSGLSGGYGSGSSSSSPVPAHEYYGSRRGHVARWADQEEEEVVAVEEAEGEEEEAEWVEEVAVFGEDEDEGLGAGSSGGRGVLGAAWASAGANGHGAELRPPFAHARVNGQVPQQHQHPEEQEGGADGDAGYGSPQMGLGEQALRSQVLGHPPRPGRHERVVVGAGAGLHSGQGQQELQQQQQEATLRSHPLPHDQGEGPVRVQLQVGEAQLMLEPQSQPEQQQQQQLAGLEAGHHGEGDEALQAAQGVQIPAGSPLNGWAAGGAGGGGMGVSAIPRLTLERRPSRQGLPPPAPIPVIRRAP